MQSFRSRIFIFLLRHRHWIQFRSKQKAVDWNTSISDLRQAVEKSSGLFGKLPAGIKTGPTAFNHLKAELIQSGKSDRRRLILYFHGGGYVMGSIRTHLAIAARFVKCSGINALLFDYRLAPEHPFPAALEDALQIYTGLLNRHFSPDKMVFMGDSAGGGLCLAALLAIRDRGLALPAAAVALSPWTDLKCTGNSYLWKDPLVPEGIWKVFGRYYSGDNDPGSPLISPLYGDLYGLPPLFLSVGGAENLRDDSIRFADKAGKSGTSVTLRVGEGMFHCYPFLSPLLPEARTAMNEICAFIRENIGPA